MKKLLAIFSTLAMLATLAMLFVSCDNNDDHDIFGSINGTVAARETNAPILGANVILSPGGAAAQTDAAGFYEFKNLEPGDYAVSVQHTGYKTDNSVITVRVGESATVNFSLVEGGN